MPDLKMIDLFLSIVVSLILFVVIFTSNYVLGFTYRWLLLFGIGLIAAGKALASRESKPSNMIIYWNFAFYILLLLGGFLVSLSHIDYSNAGSYIFIIACVIDIGVMAYGYFAARKMATPTPTPETKTVSSEATGYTAVMSGEMPSMLPLILDIVGDIVLVGGFAYAVSQA